LVSFTIGATDLVVVTFFCAVATKGNKINAALRIEAHIEKFLIDLQVNKKRAV
jgi:hypothetical protein